MFHFFTVYSTISFPYTHLVDSLDLVPKSKAEQSSQISPFITPRNPSLSPSIPRLGYIFQSHLSRCLVF